jgi:excisionase family DNA binding protein
MYMKKTDTKTDTAIRLLTLAEAASILKISKRTLHRMIQQKQIPAFKVGGQWRILESRFQEWVEEEENSVPKQLSISSRNKTLPFVRCLSHFIASVISQSIPSTYDVDCE